MRFLVFIFFFACAFKAWTQQPQTLKTVDIWKNTSVESIDLSEVDSGLVLVLSSENLGSILQSSGHLQINNLGRFGSASSASAGGLGSDQVKVYWEGIELNQLTLGMFDFSLFPGVLQPQISVLQNSGLQNIGNQSIGSSVHLNQSKPKNQLQFEVGSFQHISTALSQKISSNNWNAFIQLYHIQAQNQFNYTDGDIKREASHNRLEQTGTQGNLVYKEKHQWGWWVQSRYKQLPSNLGQFKPPLAQQYDDLNKFYYRYNRNKNTQAQLDYSRDILHYQDKLSVTSTDYDIDSKIEINRWGANVNQLWNIKNIKVNWQAQGLWYGVNSTGFSQFETQFRISSGLDLIIPWKNFEILTKVNTEKVERYKPFAKGLAKLLFKQNHFQAWFSAANKYRVPDFNDLFWTPGGNPNLKNENGIEVTGGIKLALHAKTKTNFTAQYIYREIENQIVWLPYQSYVRPINLHAAKSQQYMLRLKSELLSHSVHKLKLTAWMNFNRAQSRRSEASIDHNFLPYLPRYNFGIRSQFQFKKHQIFIQAQEIGRRYIDYTFNYYSSLVPYLEINAGIGSKINIKDQSIQFNLSLINLLNNQDSFAAARPNPGRYYRLKINFIIP